jgi:hypothetical protein
VNRNEALSAPAGKGRENQPVNHGERRFVFDSQKDQFLSRPMGDGPFMQNAVSFSDSAFGGRFVLAVRPRNFFPKLQFGHTLLRSGKLAVESLR